MQRPRTVSRACSRTTFARSPRASAIRASRWCSTRRRTSGHAYYRGTGRRSATTTTGTSRSSSSRSRRTGSAGSSSTRRRRRSRPRASATPGRVPPANGDGGASGRARALPAQSLLGEAIELGIEPPDSVAFGDAADALHEGGRPQARAFLGTERPHAVEGARHDLLQPCRDLALAPEVVLEILDPLEIRDDDAAGVREDVGDHRHPAIAQDRDGLRGRRRSEEHTSELQSPCNLVCRLLLEKKNSTYAIRPPSRRSSVRDAGPPA